MTGIRTWILQQLEAEPGRWMLWLPVALGLGIAIYFELPSEPAIWLGPALTPAAACGAFLAPGGSRARALCVHWPRGGGCVIQRPPEGMRVVLEAARLKGNGAPVPKITPAKLRVSLGKGAPPLHVGDRILVLANLSGPAGPAAPGAFDFQRVAWYQQLGAVTMRWRRPW